MKYLLTIVSLVSLGYAQKPLHSLERAFEAAASRAIRTKASGVSVVEVLDSHPRRNPSDPVILHSVSVTQIIKARRSDHGVYFTFSTLVEDTRTGEVGKPLLRAGTSYIVAVEMRGLPYRCDEVVGAIVGRAGDAVAERLMRESALHASYGSDPVLDAYLSFPVDLNGVRSCKSDGSVDPLAFGCDRGACERLAEREGMYVVISRGRPPGSNSGTVVVLETIAGPTLNGDVVAAMAEDDRELRRSASKMDRCYAPRYLVTGALYLVRGRVRDGEIVEVLQWIPLIGRDDGCVQAVRSWCRAAESRPR